MFGNLGELAKLIVLMNEDGRKLMINYAKDVIGHKELRKPDEAMTPAQFDRSVEQVLGMIKRA